MFLLGSEAFAELAPPSVVNDPVQNLINSRWVKNLDSMQLRRENKSNQERRVNFESIDPGTAFRSNPHNCLQTEARGVTPSDSGHPPLLNSTDDADIMQLSVKLDETLRIYAGFDVQVANSYCGPYRSMSAPRPEPEIGIVYKPDPRKLQEYRAFIHPFGFGFGERF